MSEITNSFFWISDCNDDSEISVMGTHRTLIVDDNVIFIEKVTRALFNLHEISSVQTFEEARTIIKSRTFDIILLDKHLPQNRLGTDLIPEIKMTQPHAVIIVLTADKADESVLEALQNGASDYLQKTPTITSDLMGRISVALQRLQMERRLQKAESLAAEKMNVEMAGSSEALLNLKQVIRTLAPNPINILISGETGTGKELVARSLNQQHGDKGRPFVALNCGALAPQVVESELFGHKKGAFTGATADKVGKIEAANGGDLFLDEIGELTLDIQVKLLRVLQEGQYCRVGCNQERHSQFRVISATNRDLQQRIGEGAFREDLYYRIAAFEIETTPLRDRKEDIPELLRHFIRKIEGPRYSATDEVLEYCNRQRWKGNIRELENKIRSSLAFAKSRGSYVITLADFVQNRVATKEIKVTLKDISNLPSHFQYVATEYETYRNELDKKYLIGALDTYDWDLETTAKKLGMSRTTIYDRFSTYGLKELRQANRRGLNS